MTVKSKNICLKNFLTVDSRPQNSTTKITVISNNILVIFNNTQDSSLTMLTNSLIVDAFILYFNFWFHIKCASKSIQIKKRNYKENKCSYAFRKILICTAYLRITLSKWCERFIEIPYSLRLPDNILLHFLCMHT